MKLCKDCRWYLADSGSEEYDLCTNETISSIAEKKRKGEASRLVRGTEPKPHKIYGFCSLQRDSPLLHDCGMEGRFWEPLEITLPAFVSCPIREYPRHDEEEEVAPTAETDLF